MLKFFNIDMGKYTDYEISYQNANNDLVNQTNQLNANMLQLFTHKMEEYRKLSTQHSIVNDQINERRERLQCIAKKLETEQQTLQTETERLESVINESRQLHIAENNLSAMINETKMQQTQVYNEKKQTIKNLKRQINSFKYGLSMYEQYLQLSMDIQSEDKITLISITMRNLKNQTNYNVILEENDNNFKLIDVRPHNQSVTKAAQLYNQNKDIQGLFAFLFFA